MKNTSLFALALAGAFSGSAYAREFIPADSVRTSVIPAPSKEREIAAVPVAVAPVITGQPIQWRKVKPRIASNGNERNAPNWVAAFDNLLWNVNGGTGSSAHGTNLYGATGLTTPTVTFTSNVTTSTGTQTRYSDISSIVEDISLNPLVNDGTFIAHRFRTRWIWNPANTLANAGAPTGGSARMVVFVGTSKITSTTDASAAIAATPFGNALVPGIAYTNPAGTFRGYLIDFGEGNSGGSYFWDSALGADLGVILPLPDTRTAPGGAFVAVGTVDADGDFVPLNFVAPFDGNAQIRQSQGAMASSPLFPGSNPSETSNSTWRDGRQYFAGNATVAAGYYYGSDFTIDTLANGLARGAATPQTELENGVITSTNTNFNGRRFNAAIGFATDLDAKKLSVNLNFNGTFTTSSGRTFTYAQLVPLDANDNPFPLTNGNDWVFGVLNMKVDAGDVNLSSGVLQDPGYQDGTLNAYTKYRLQLKPAGFLRAYSPIWNTSANLSANITLVGGDVDDDNEISILDYLKVSEYYEKTSNDADWLTAGSDGLAPIDADLDDDGNISILDYLIVSANYGQSGEPDLRG